MLIPYVPVVLGFALARLVLCSVVFAVAPSPCASPQDNPSDASLTPSPRKLSDRDARRVEELQKQIDHYSRAGKFVEAQKPAQDVLAICEKALGADNWQTADARRTNRTLKTIAALPEEGRKAMATVSALFDQRAESEKKAHYTEAERLSRELVAITERWLGPDDPYTATSINNLAANLGDQGKYAEAQPLYEKALEIKRRLLTEDHPSTATTYNNLAANLGAQGKHAEAQPHFEKALVIHRRLLSEDHPDTATSINNLAANLGGQGKYAEAQPLYEKALDIKRRLLTEDHPSTATSYNNLADNLSAQGKYAEAQPLYEKALEICRRLLTDDHPDTAATYRGLAANLGGQGKYAEAQPLYEKALEIHRRLLTDDHPQTADSYYSLAVNLSYQGKYAEAQPLHVKALEIRRRLLTDDHPDTALSYDSLAVNLIYQGKYAEAQSLHEKALEICRRLLTDDHPLTARSYNNLAVNLSYQGNYAEAQPLYVKALEIRRRLLTDDHPDTAICYSGLAGNLNSQGKHAEAQPLFEKALEIHRRLLTDDHPDTATSYRDLAGNLNAQGKYAEARDQWLQAARAMETGRLSAAFSGLDRSRGQRIAPRLFLGVLLARLGEPSEAWESFERHLGQGLLDELAARQDTRLTEDERDTLRRLTADLGRFDRLFEAAGSDPIAPEPAKQLEELSRQRLSASAAIGEFQTQLARKYGPLAGDVTRLAEIQVALPTDAALIAWVDTLPPVGPGAADPDGEHWGVVVRSKRTPTWIALAGSGDDGLWTDDDWALGSSLRTAITSEPPAPASEIDRLAMALRIQRLKPLESALAATDTLPQARRLIVLPSSALAGVPIDLLLEPDDNRVVSYAPSARVLTYLRKQPRSDASAGLLALGDPIFRRPDASTTPPPPPDYGLLVNMVVPGSNAARHDLLAGDVLLSYNGRKLQGREDLQLVGSGTRPVRVEIWRQGKLVRGAVDPGQLGIVIESRPATQAIAANREFDRLLVATRSRSGSEELEDLPGTRHEVGSLARMFRQVGRPVRELYGSDASEPNLDALAQAGELGRFAFLHLATHGRVDLDIPERSAVILTQTGLPDSVEQVLQGKNPYDGELSVREIQRSWQLNAELVTLSACQTALGKQAGGEGLMGFTQALLMSGARSVCLSLWKVDDQATSLLMRRFYENLLGMREGLKAPMPKAEALHEAKVWLRNLKAEEVEKQLRDLDKSAPGQTRSPPKKPQVKTAPKSAKPFEHPHYWASFILIGDPD